MTKASGWHVVESLWFLSHCVLILAKQSVPESSDIILLSHSCTPVSILWLCLASSQSFLFFLVLPFFQLLLYHLFLLLSFTLHISVSHSPLLFVPVTLSSTTTSPLSLSPSEERVVPLEVSRSKLSRHLQGLVFRCHKCTFTCSSDQTLQQHLQKHAELKPYQCQLCYYDSSRRNQLEEHLRLEHKVSPDRP